MGEFFAIGGKAPPAEARAEEAAGGFDLVRAASWAAVVLGSLFCLFHFLGGRSLWTDEAMLALNIKYLSPAELTKKLDYAQVAPLGWLLLQKALYDLTHDAVHALRLTSLVAGVGSMVLFRNLAFRELDRLGALAATLFFCFSPPVVRYAAEIKPYEVDIFLAVLMLTAALPLTRGEKSNWPAVLLLAFTGFLAAFFSFAALFVLAVCTGAAILRAGLKRRWPDAAALIAMSVAWLACFAWVYLTVYKPQLAGSDLTSGGSNDFFSRSAYAPLIPTSAGDVAWYANWAEALFTFLFLRDSMFAMALLAAAGFFHLARKHMWLFAMTAGTVAFSLVISGLHLYPIYDRLALFLLPSFVIAAGAGVSLFKGPSKAGWAAPLALTALGLAAAVPYLGGNLLKLKPPFALQYVPAAFARLQTTMKPGDVLYTGNFTIPSFMFHSPDYGFDRRPWVWGEVGDKTWRCVERRLPQIPAGGSIWLLVSNFTDPTETVAKMAAESGLELQTDFVAPGAWVYRMPVGPAGLDPKRMSAEEVQRLCVDHTSRQRLDPPPRILARYLNGGG